MFGLRHYGDISDVAELIAPRHCMVQIASNDTCFIEEDALEAFRHLKQIYQAASAEENLQLDNFEGVHEIDLEPATEFLKKHL